MRELKFRVWDKRYKQYVKPYAICLDGRAIVIAEPCDDRETLDSERIIIEQYTGLKDKNGKEIYEGDVLDVSSVFVKPKKMIVKFSEMACGFEPFANGCPDCYFPEGKDVVVIGNIHENPELLEQEEE